MAYEQENGWPLGLQPLNVRIGLVRNHDFSGSISFNTLLTDSSPSSTDFSSDLDTESSAGSFFNDRSITLGSLIDLSARSSSIRGITKSEVQKTTNFKSKIWFFNLCSKNHHIEDEISTDQIFLNHHHPPSLAHFLEVERKAAHHKSDDDEQRLESISLFINGHIAPPHSSSQSNPWRSNSSVFFSCICGQPTI